MKPFKTNSFLTSFFCLSILLLTCNNSVHVSTNNFSQFKSEKIEANIERYYTMKIDKADFEAAIKVKTNPSNPSGPKIKLKRIIFQFKMESKTADVTNFIVIGNCYYKNANGTDLQVERLKMSSEATFTEETKMQTYANVEMRATDISDIRPSDGVYDYIRLKPELSPNDGYMIIIAEAVSVRADKSELSRGRTQLNPSPPFKPE